VRDTLHGTHGHVSDLVTEREPSWWTREALTDGREPESIREIGRRKGVESKSLDAEKGIPGKGAIPGPNGGDSIMTVTPLNPSRFLSPILQNTPATPASEPKVAPGSAQPGAARGRNTADVVLRAQTDPGFDALPVSRDILNLRNSAKDGGTFADRNELRSQIDSAVRNNGGRPLDRLTVFADGFDSSLSLGLTTSQSVADLAGDLRAGGMMRRGADLVLPGLVLNDASMVQELQRAADASDIRITVASKYPGTFVTFEKGKPMDIGGIDTPAGSPDR
jgi:hypothetical protein